MVINAPRLLVHVGANASIELVEEYVSLVASTPEADTGSYLTCSVAELSLGEHASVHHRYVQVRHSMAVKPCHLWACGVLFLATRLWLCACCRGYAHVPGLCVL